MSSGWTADVAPRSRRSRTSTSRRSCAAAAEAGGPDTRSRLSDPDAADVAALRLAHERVRERIALACARVGRAPAGVELVAVSKGVAAERLRAAMAAGIEAFGESRVREAEGKVAAVAGATWHLVGRLQSNKALRAATLFDVVHSVDSVALARRLDRVAGRRLGVYLQVNVDADPHKAGFSDAELERGLPELSEAANLDLRGLMTVGRLVRDATAARPTFVALAELSDRLRIASPALGPGLSMGMSDDYEVAVEEGATVVRIGRAIFGERPGD